MNVVIEGIAKVISRPEPPQVSIQELTADELKQIVPFFRKSRQVKLTEALSSESGGVVAQAFRNIQDACQFYHDVGRNPTRVGVEEFDWAVIQTNPFDNRHPEFVDAGPSLVFRVKGESAEDEAFCGVVDIAGRFGDVYPHRSTASLMISCWRAANPRP